MSSNSKLSCLLILILQTSHADPGLTIRTPGGGAMWLELAEELKGESLVLQDSYDARSWRDLASFDDVDIYKEGRRWFIGKRFYRAVAKELDQPMAALAKARERWQASAFTEYQYVYWNSGEFGLFEELVAVRDGKIVESYTVQESEHDLGKQTRTIDQLLTAIEAAWDEGAVDVRVRYHPTLGYPETTFVDYDTRIADEEWSHEIVVPPGTADEALDRSRKLWQRANADNYQYHLMYQSNLAHWDARVEVTDGVAKFISTDTNRPADAVASTIEQIQEKAESAITNGSDTYFAYHPDSGMPTFLSINWTATFVDGPGQQLRISDFTEL